MSTHSYTRVFSAGSWDLDVRGLTKEIKLALPGKLFSVHANNTDVDCIFVDTLTAGEITTLDTTVSDHKTAGGPSGDIDFDKNYQEEEYSNRKLLLKRTWFAVKVSEGVYTHPVEEHIFTHQGTRLMSQRIKKYNAAGDVLSDKPYDFTTSGNKVRKELAP